MAKKMRSQAWTTLETSSSMAQQMMDWSIYAWSGESPSLKPMPERVLKNALLVQPSPIPSFSPLPQT
jgi:hypothetical protein